MPSTRARSTAAPATCSRARPAKAVAVAVASRLADATGRQIELHYGIGSSPVGAIHRRLADRPDALKVVEFEIATADWSIVWERPGC